MSAIPLSHLADAGDGPSGFLSVLPAIVNHAKIRFGRLRPEAKAEAVAETVAAAYQNYHRLECHNQLDRAFVSTLADYAARHVAQNRQVGSSQSSRDALSPLAQKRHRFAVASFAGECEECWRLSLLEKRRVSPAEQAIFKVDFERWLVRFPSRQRRIINELAAGESTSAVAERFGLTAGRVSQLRRKFEQSWSSYQGEFQTCQ